MITYEDISVKFNNNYIIKDLNLNIEKYDKTVIAQFEKILAFYKKRITGKVTDPRLVELLNVISERIKILND